MIGFIHTEKSFTSDAMELNPPLAEGMIAINSITSIISYKSPISA